MSETAHDMLNVLRSNRGFATLDHATLNRWLPFATREKFHHVNATPICACPDCGAPPRDTLGQYVYYSTLMRLRECSCGLIWADAAIDPAVIATHFEGAYKDERYFELDRGAIFEQLAGLIAKHTPKGGSVIDIGGGMGHLMNVTRNVRSDLELSVLDISEDSVEYCRTIFGIDAQAGTLATMEPRVYDTAVLSDVLYYEGDMLKAWEVLSRVARTLIIRGPNKLKWIRAASKYDPLQTNIKHFNPEHQFILSRAYLDKRLRKCDFFSIEFLPTPPLTPRSTLKRSISDASYAASVALHKLTGVVSSPSMVTIASKSSRYLQEEHS